MTNAELGRIAEAFALTQEGFTPAPAEAPYDCLYGGEPCEIKATRRVCYTQSSGEQVEQTRWWLWVLIDGDTGDVLAHELVPKSEHSFGKPYVNYKYVAPNRIVRQFAAILGAR
jgi:hypothetical protein